MLLIIVKKKLAFFISVQELSNYSQQKLLEFGMTEVLQLPQDYKEQKMNNKT
jgi:hypothetical protein